MLRIVLDAEEEFDNKTQTFGTVKEEIVIDLEHSLLSLSKWESKHEKPFLTLDEKTDEELFDYLKFMILTPNLPPDTFSRFSKRNVRQVEQYINSSQSATVIDSLPSHGGVVAAITSELIYYWMVAFTIPFHPAETWHLNRLFKLIQICSIKNQKPQKMSNSQIAEQNARINAERRAKYGTSG